MHKHSVRDDERVRTIIVYYSLLGSPGQAKCIRYPYRVLDTVKVKYILLFMLSFIRLLLKGHNISIERLYTLHCSYECYIYYNK